MISWDITLRAPGWIYELGSLQCSWCQHLQSLIRVIAHQEEILLRLPFVDIFCLALHTCTIMFLLFINIHDLSGLCLLRLSWISSQIQIQVTPVPKCIKPWFNSSLINASHTHRPADNITARWLTLWTCSPSLHCGRVHHLYTVDVFTIFTARWLTLWTCSPSLHCGRVHHLYGAVAYTVDVFTIFTLWTCSPSLHCGRVHHLYTVDVFTIFTARWLTLWTCSPSLHCGRVHHLYGAVAYTVDVFTIFTLWTCSPSLHCGRVHHLYTVDVFTIFTRPRTGCRLVAGCEATSPN